MDSFFFRVEHDLLRSEAFKALGGSAIKVYLVIGLHSDFGTGWAYPSIRTIAREAGLSRQTVLTALHELARAGLLASSKSKGRSTAYKIVRQAPERPDPGRKGKRAGILDRTSPISSGEAARTGPIPFDLPPETGPKSFEVAAQRFGPAGPGGGPKPEQSTREDTTSIPIPGTPFRLTAEGRLVVAVDLQELLTDQGITPRLAERLVKQKAPEDVAKVLLNAFFLRSQGKLQNGAGYIRAGLEDGYDLLPQVADRLELRRKELEATLRTMAARRERSRQEAERDAEETAIRMVLERLGPDELQSLVEQAIASLPEPLVRRNPTLSNPFVRGRVYELAAGEPLA